MATAAKVVTVQGEAFARSANGTMRRLAAGDSIEQGEVVITSAGGAASLRTADGQMMSINSQESFQFGPESTQATAPGAGEAALAAGAPAATVIQPGEVNVEQLLADEAAAAGLGGGGENGGSSFVRLMRISEEVNPNSFDFQDPAGAGLLNSLGLDGTDDGVPNAGDLVINLDEDDLTYSQGEDYISTAWAGDFMDSFAPGTQFAGNYDSGNQDDALGDDDPASTPTTTYVPPTTMSGKLNFNYGEDGMGDITFNTPTAVLTSGPDDLQVQYWMSPDGHTLVGYVVENYEQREARAFSEDYIPQTYVKVIFSAEITDVETGAFSFTLYGPLDHPEGGTEDNLIIPFGFTVTDIDGDSAVGTLTLNLDDDMPAQIVNDDQGQSDYQSNYSDYSYSRPPMVDEDDINDSGKVRVEDEPRTIKIRGQEYTIPQWHWEYTTDDPNVSSQGTDPNDGAQRDGSFTGDRDQDYDSGPANTSGWLQQLVTVSFGADGPAAGGGYSLGTDFSGLIEQNLRSNEQPLSYRVDGDTLVAYIGGESADRLIFTLQLDSNGEYMFSLYDQLDHEPPAEQILAKINSYPHYNLGENNLPIDLSSVIIATDGDGDSIALSGGFVINVTDDVPEVGCTPTVVLEDDDLAGGIAGGWGDDDAPRNASGTLNFQYGADEAGGSVVLMGAGLLQKPVEPVEDEETDGEADASTDVDVDAGRASFDTLDEVPEFEDRDFTETLNDDGSLTIWQLQGKDGWVDVLQVTLTNPPSGDYLVQQLNNILHPEGGYENNVDFAVQYLVTDGDDDKAYGTLRIDVDDDSPDAKLVVYTPDTLVLDESPLPAGGDGVRSITANFADNFMPTDGIKYGADGPGSVSYALNLERSYVKSGLYALDPNDTSTKDWDGIGQGSEIVLNQSGNIITGSVGSGSSKVDYFTIEIDPSSGVVTFTQLNNIWHDQTPANDGDNTETLSAHERIWFMDLGRPEWLQVVQTVTDADGDSDSASINLGQGVFKIEDDGPNADTAHCVPLDTLVLDESPKGADTGGDYWPAGRAMVTANFADNFKTPDYGTDGPGKTVYSLNLEGSKVKSGLFALDPTDTHDGYDGIGQGSEIVLNQSGNIITGSVGNTNYFTIEIAPATGVVTFTQLNNIWHDNTHNDDDSETLDVRGVCTEHPDWLQIVQTVTDADGDSDSAYINLGDNVFKIEDDGPSVWAKGVVTLDDTNLGQSTNIMTGTLGGSFGSDGAGQFDFAGMQGDKGKVGTENVKYTWNDGTDTLTATVDGGARNDTALFQVHVTNPATGAYTVTQLDNVLHAAPVAPITINTSNYQSLAGVVSISVDAPGHHDGATLNINDGAFGITSNTDGGQGGRFDEINFIPGEGRRDPDASEVMTFKLLQGDATSATINFTEFYGNEGGVGNERGSYELYLNGVKVQSATQFEADSGGNYQLVVTRSGGFDEIRFAAKFGSNDGTGGDSSDYNVGSITFNLQQPVDATAALTYTVTDADGDHEDGTLNLKFNDDEPAAVNDLRAVVEDVTPSINGNVLTDGTGDSFGTDGPASSGSIVWDANTAAKATLNAYGTLTLDSDGNYIYTLTDAAQALREGQIVQSELGYTIKDADGDTSHATLKITITGTNDAPVLSDTVNPLAIAELVDAHAQNLAAITGSFAVSDKDIGDTLTASVVGSPVVKLGGVSFEGAPALTAAGVFSIAPITQTSNGGAGTAIGYKYDPAAANLDFLKAGESLTVTYQVMVSDGIASSTQDVTFTITGTNDAPVAVADSVLSNNIDQLGIFAADVIEIPKWSLLANDTDVDGAAQSIGTISNIQNLVGVTDDGLDEIAVDLTGGGSFDYTASDGSATSATATVTIDRSQAGQAQLDGTNSGEILIGREVLADTILGDGGNDVLIGASGSDTLTGGTGSDAFGWKQGEFGRDHITDFNLAPVASGGDVLNLSDLLGGEHANAASLDGYLNFSAGTGTDAGKTVITVDVNAGGLGGGGQTIVLDNVSYSNLQSYAGGAGDDAAIISKLLSDGNLKVDS